MAQISRHQLHPDLEREIRSQFAGFFSSISTASNMHSFLHDFLTPTENVMLAKRFMIMVLLMRGRSTVEIKDILHVSNSTIISVSSWLKYPSPATRELLAKIKVSKDLQAIGDKLESILAKLPPPKYRNWSMVGMEKAAQAKSRNIKASLR